MSDTPELDQVADARRQIAEHARFSVTYWVLYGVLLVFLAGIPIWRPWTEAAGLPSVSWGIAAVGIGAAVCAWIRRRRSGVHLVAPGQPQRRKVVLPNDPVQPPDTDLSLKFVLRVCILGFDGS